MKILHVIPTYIPAWRYGGPMVSVHGLCRALGRTGHEVHVFTTNVDGPNDSPVPVGKAVDVDGVHVWYFRSRHLRRFYWAPDMEKMLKSKIHEFRIVHLHSVYLWPVSMAARTALKNHVPFILSPRGMLVRDLIQRRRAWAKRLWLKFQGRVVLEKADGIHVTSELEAREAAGLGFKLPKIFVVPNGIDPRNESRDSIRGGDPAAAEISNSKPYFLFLGRVHWKKGLDRLIPALASCQGVRLVIAGNDEEDYRKVLQKLAGQYHVEDRIKFTGYVEGPNKRLLLENAVALALPSYSENFGNVVLEAMAAACPVLVTPEVGLSDVVGETGAGMVVRGEPSEIAKGLNFLLSNPEKAREMGLRGQETANKRFAWQTVAEQMGDIYQQIAENHLRS